MEYTFYKIYSNPNDLTEFKYCIWDEGGKRDTFTEEKFNQIWERCGEPTITTESGNSEIAIIDGVPTLNLDVIKANRKQQLQQNPASYMTKQEIEIACNSLNELQNLLLYSEKNSITEIPFKDYTGKIRIIALTDIQSFIDQLIAYQLLLNQIQLKNEQIIDEANTYTELIGIEKIEVNEKDLEEQIADVAVSIDIKPIVEEI